MPSLEKLGAGGGSTEAPETPAPASAPATKGLPFSLVSDLLERCSPSLVRESIAEIVIDWFKVHHGRIHSPDCNLAALLSTLLPEKRTDRVYCLNSTRLEKIVVRALSIGRSRRLEFEAFKEPGEGLDLADCVERILIQTPNPVQPEGSQITVEEVDGILHGIASRIRWSSPSIRALDATLRPHHPDDLADVYRRLSPQEAKWFTRLVLKDFRPVVLHPGLVYSACHRMLPSILNIRDNFEVAIQTLQNARFGDPSPARLDRDFLTTIKPQLSVKVGRQLWFKARSIKHCLSMCQGRMSVEKKMDGEYCQIHVDVSKGKRSIQIFSKSGKDSTEDREKLHEFIADSLKLGQPDSSVKADCILEGELLVFSNREQKILPFHHIRNHVARRGRLIHHDYESRPQPGEHLMIVYYDILLLDGQSLLNTKHSERFQLLEKTISCSPGYADIVPRQIIDTGHPLGASDLRKAFANVIRERGEGLVLKADLPYFNFHATHLPFNGKCIKFKKEYIGEFGDVGDFAIVGAGYNPQKAKAYDIPNLKWTHFFVGCLDNREEVIRWGATPRFTVVNEIELNATLLRTFLAHLTTLSEPVPVAENKITKIQRFPVIEVSGALITAFTKPPVLDVRCFSFEKMADTGFWGLRFPTATKIHFDRDFTDTLSFDELQEIAEKAVATPKMDDSQENLDWIAKLERADPRGVAVDALTQETTTTGPSPSPVKPSLVASASCPSTMSLGSSQSQQGIDPPRGKHALSQGSDVTPSRPPKRCQIQMTEDSRGACSTTSRGQDVAAASRQPLEDIDVNSVQGSQQSSRCPAFTESFAQSFSESCVGTLPLRPGHLDTIQRSHEAVEDATSETSTEREEPSQDGPSRETEQLPETTTDAPPGATRACRFVGSQCQLAKKVILMDSSLQAQTPELYSLLEDHGLIDKIRDPESWVEEDRLRSLSATEWQPGKGALLLVDGVGRKAETRRLIAAMEEMRGDVPKKHRNWIGVYDWRVLRHVSIMEDADVTKKYYDGFSNPWQRWSFGLI